MTDRDRLIRERLIELIRNSNCVSTWDYHLDDFKDPNPVLKLADYLLANGVMVPPVKIGTVVYEIRAKGKGSPRGRYCDYSVTTDYSLKNAIERGLDLYIEQKLFVKTDMTRWNKTVFLTKEEAEEKLKELNKGE